MPNLAKVKPVLGGDYSQVQWNKHIFDNPLFEHYVTSYMEETQETAAEYVAFDQFKNIAWRNGVPCFLFDFLSHLTGLADEVYSFFGQRRLLFLRAAREDLEN